ncbi:hypothetical protein G6F70_008944 [Rhizopus microsporus]|nr:hypothetical protein G6F71_007421 [Rhizopus microsporus]KAG1194021.1 hypothetical protein G6F70_008944 [Rhizopus microsporus]KAG1208180.1 hypothetical protein G6F69_007437 [Rhizopus microsporus]KAG1229400.1 hypothetical protein G6F67_007176 [Rhizopus microsporus]KAG1261335.1 hypothetical protein G6F68_006756 [Rhizopus microsporus]
MAERSIELPANFDFDNYINNYKDYNKIFRSLYIAKKCSQLAVKAYRQAIKDIKENTLDVEKYKSTITELNNVLERKGEPTEALDQSWIDHVRITSKTTLESLENELKVAKSRLLKEEMRVNFIGGVVMDRQLSETLYEPETIALQTNIQQKCALKLSRQAYECNFSHVIQTYLARAETIPNTAQSIGVNSKLKCFQTLTLLGRTDVPKKYRSIANTLIDIPFEACAAFDDVLSPNDVAIYGGLSALASFDRRELQSQVLSNANFKNFLALEPALYELIESFYQSKYTHCFEVLKKYKQQLRLDMYMESNVDHLIQLVHEKAIAQYCVPYSIIDMRKMAAAFSIDIETLEEILTDLIGKNKTMAARIDSHNKIVRTKKQNKRTQAFDQSFIAGNDFEKSSRALLLRLNLLKADLIMK